MIVACENCNTSFNLEDERVKKSGSKARCSKCKNIFMVYPPVIVEEQNLSEVIKEQEIDIAQIKTEALPVSDSKDTSIVEVDDSVEQKEEDAKEPDIQEVAERNKGVNLSEEAELDFSDLSESMEKAEIASTNISADDGEKEPKLLDSEDIDFSELEKMLENGEINFDNLLSEVTEDKFKFSDTEEIDLSEIDEAIDNFEDTDIEEVEEDSRELKLDFESDLEPQILKNKDSEELDFSDLEMMADFEEATDSQEYADKTGGITSELSFDSELKSAGQKSEDDSEELDFSDLEKILDTETDAEESVVNPSEETAELSLDIDLHSDSRQEIKFEETAALGDDELDFSDLEKMLETEKIADEPAKELSNENLELSLQADEPSEKEHPDYLSDTIAMDDMKLGVRADEVEPEEYLKKMEKFDINKFQDTVAVEKDIIGVTATGKAQSEKKEPGKVMPPQIKKKFFSKYLLIFAVIFVLIIGSGVFIYYNAFGLKIPFISEYITSKVDQKGNLNITPVPYTLKGDFIDTKSGTLFVITGRVRNDYRHPISQIKLIGKIFTKGKVLFKAESVYCGNELSQQELSDLDPVVIKRRLQSRLGDKKSNMHIKPGATVPFMVIFENPSSALDEFVVEAESSIKE